MGKVVHFRTKPTKPPTERKELYQRLRSSPRYNQENRYDDNTLHSPVPGLYLKWAAIMDRKGL